jgi:glycerol-3-phosphate dehydrogenase (NAD(P)+)
VLGGPVQAPDAVEHGASVVLASIDRAFAKQLADVFAKAGFDVSLSRDVTGVELAGCAKNMAVLAAAAAADAGPNVAGAAAGKIFAEVEGFARSRGGQPETFAGLAGAGDLVATVAAVGSPEQRAGEMLSRGIAPEHIASLLGHAAEAVDSVPLLAGVAREGGVETPALDGLAALVEGRLDLTRWAETVTAPSGSGSAGASRSDRAA